MKKFISLGCIVGSLALTATAQEPTPAKWCSEARASGLIRAKTTVANLAEDDYDMQYVKMNLAMNNMSTFISGDVTTRAKVVVPSMSAYVFELHPAYIIDSLKFNGQVRPVTGTGAVRTVSLQDTLAQDSVFTVQVFYKGQIPASSVPGFFAGGIRTQQSPSWGANVTYTLSQPYGARDWWPTKQSLTDKIDSADIWITVLSHLKAGSNGVLKNITPMIIGKQRYEWKTTYPIDYYLLSVSVAPYVDYSYMIGFPGTNDSVLYQNYIYDNPQTLTTWKPQIDSVPGMLIYFSELFGRYPFWQEKYGHCMAPLSGGMEHQTMSTQGYFPTTLSAHELAHQWFGDNVTCGSWADVWLNEGFASYAEYLYVRHFRGAAQGFNYMADMHDDVMQSPGGSVYVDDTTSESRIFSSRLSYKKGASIVHSLRFIFDNDSLFFQLLKDYQQQFGGATALTDDFQTLAEQVSGKNLDTFFNQWIYSEGFPTYSAKWNQVGNQVYVQLEQVTSMPVSLPLFYTPIELKFKSLVVDTVVRVYNDKPVQVYSFTWGKPMMQLEIDPNNWIVNGDLGTVKDVSLNTKTLENPAAILIHPNPARTAWQIQNLPGKAQLQLTDVEGKIVWSYEADGAATIHAAGLASGIYFLRVHSNTVSESFKLIKQ